MPQPTQPPAPPAPAPQPTPPAPAPEPPAPQPTSQTVPYDRFSQVNSEKAAAEKRAADAEARLQALEDQNKSELEKAQAQAAREKARADAADATVAKITRDNAVRSLATQQIGDRPAAIDADAVIALLDTGQYGEVKADDPASVTAAIGKLHEAKPTLFATSATPPQPQPFGMPASVPAPAQNNGTQPEPGSEREGMGRAMLGMLRGGV
jgi:multidrug efflux pump subunit AcrA (membrane-fusion protein)